MTPLLWTGDKEVAELLLAKGADINAKNNNGVTPLHLAISNRRPDLADFLRQHGGQDAAPGHTPPGGIYAAAMSGNVEQVKALLQANPELVSSKDENGRTALHWAAMFNQVAVAEALLAGKADINAKDNHGLTPLHEVSKKEMADFLLANKAEIEAKNEEGRTPLHAAAAHGKPGMTGVVESLLAHGADVNARSNNGWTPLLETALTDHRDVAEILLQNKADLNARSNDGVTPLHVAAYFAHKDMVDLLLSHGADVNAKANDGATPLSNAAGYLGHLDVVELLLARGADVNARGRDGFTPLHAAITDGHPDVADLLRQHGGHE